jgi:hypothetical protein
VLGYVAAGLLVIAGLLLFFSASIIASWRDVAGDTTGGLSAEFALAGTVNVISAALFIAGGVVMTNRSPFGRALYYAAAGLTVVETLYWLARWAGPSDGAVVFYAIMFAALAVVGTCLAALGDSSRWLRATDRAQPAG